MALGEHSTRAKKRAVGVPPPLDAVDKLFVILDWARPEQGLLNSELRVLIRLVERQNPRTGRCDPSVMTLITDTRLSKRSVAGALATLQVKGAIARNPDPGSSRRKWVIFPTRQKHYKDAGNSTSDANVGSQTGQKPAMKHANDCNKPVQPTAHIKEKGKKKEKLHDQRMFSGSTAESAAPEICRDNYEGNVCAEQKFELLIKSEFEANGFRYEDVMDIPIEDFEEARGEWIRGVIDIAVASEYLLQVLSEC